MKGRGSMAESSKGSSKDNGGGYAGPSSAEDSKGTLKRDRRDSSEAKWFSMRGLLFMILHDIVIDCKFSFVRGDVKLRYISPSPKNGWWFCR